MNIPLPKSIKKEKKHFTNEGVLESLTGIATQTIDSVKKDVVDDGAHEAWNKLLLADKKDQEASHGNRGGDMSAGHEIDLSGASEKVHTVTEAGHEFVREITHAGERAQTEESQENQIKIQEILIEIEKLSESSEELKQKVEVISIQQTGENQGVYHVNFLEFMLSKIHDLRVNAEDSLAWFGALGNKKKARQYNSMAKTHGTSFTLSNERQVATQVG